MWTGWGSAVLAVLDQMLPTGEVGEIEEVKSPGLRGGWDTGIRNVKGDAFTSNWGKWLGSRTVEGQ